MEEEKILFSWDDEHRYCHWRWQKKRRKKKNKSLKVVLNGTADTQGETEEGNSYWEGINKNIAADDTEISKWDQIAASGGDGENAEKLFPEHYNFPRIGRTD